MGLHIYHQNVCGYVDIYMSVCVKEREGEEMGERGVWGRGRERERDIFIYCYIFFYYAQEE